MSKLSHVFIAFTLFICEISVKQSRFWCGIHYELKTFHYLYTQTINLNDMQDVNRLKLVLVEQKKTSKWLSEELGVSQSTVSKWCTNSSQPDIETLAKISKLLGVGVEELFNKKFMESV
jgi:DNA-binding XRE family transcriptional regulator